MLEQLAVLAKIRGDAAEAALFTRGAALVRALHIASDADLGPLVDAPPPADVDVDAEVRQRLRHMYDAGAWVLMESAIADLPADLRWLFESAAVTLEQLGVLHDALGATSAADLAAAVRQEAVRQIPGLDQTVESAIAGALPTLRAAIPRIPLGRATAIAEPVLARLRALPGVTWALPVGSLRRGQDTVGDIELVAPANDPAPAIEDLAHLRDLVRTLHRSERRLYLLINRVQVGVRFPEPANAGATLLTLTGSAEHLAALRAVALERGVHLEGPAATEEEIYDALGLPFIPPEIRSGDQEVEAARAGTLPALITRADIRGDLHMHSLWSDGRDSIEAMVVACRALGYEYLAITDHSPNAGAARNLSVDDVKRQGEEIARLREQFPDISILHGCEVDILADGRLDFPDRILERFDIVAASLHHGAGHSPDQLLRRYLGAVRHPLVTLITHPSNRLVPHRAAYDLDYGRLFEAAFETGTFVEVDGAPVHLDMDGALARRAIAAGVTVVIDSDAHRADLLDAQMQLGVVTARRGWMEPRHVVNTRPLAEVRALIARKRGR